MRLLVCGGRNYSNRQQLFDELDWTLRHVGIDLIIQGGADGADALAKEWAIINGVKNVEYKANWILYGKSAGPKRKKQMLEDGKPDWVYAFAGGIGTQNMIKQAKEVGVHVKECH